MSVGARSPDAHGEGDLGEESVGRRKGHADPGVHWEARSPDPRVPWEARSPDPKSPPVHAAQAPSPAGPAKASRPVPEAAWRKRSLGDVINRCCVDTRWLRRDRRGPLATWTRGLR